MTKWIVFLIMLCSAKIADSQNHYLDSLQEKLRHTPQEDTSRVLAMYALSDYYGFIQFDSCLNYADMTLALSEKLNYDYGNFLGYMATFHGLNSQGNYARALEAALNMQKIAEKLKDRRPWLQSYAYYFLGLLNRETSNYAQAKFLFQKRIENQKILNEPLEDIFPACSQLGILYASLGHLDSALYYAQRGYNLGLLSRKYKVYFPLAIGALGSTYLALGEFGPAEKYFMEAINQSGLTNNAYFEAKNYNNLANLFDRTNRKDSGIYYAQRSLHICQQHNFGEFAFDASRILTKIYDSENKPDSTLKYMKIMTATKDSIFSMSKGAQFQQYAFSEIQRLEKINSEKEASQNRARTDVLASALLIVLLLAFIFYRNSVRRKKDKVKIQNAYEELKSTQAQLIQSEKMASLGALTAGIAHEIQNPLNFVNNFSEVNRELIEELKSKRSKLEGEERDDILNDIDGNLEKVLQHGKRADAIVKGMLQHSRTSTGQKELTDINALADEYLRLAYHGLRAKDKSFNAKIETSFDNSIGKVNVVRQDIGRVILNLINNAFYAVSEKAKLSSNSYEPIVKVSTKKLNDKTEIRVEDNGGGISQKVLDKIFQPFFTTKPTGQGTGLGLSLAYDIIKAHAGDITVKTQEGERSEFVILLPT